MFLSSWNRGANKNVGRLKERRSGEPEEEKDELSIRTLCLESRFGDLGKNYARGSCDVGRGHGASDPGTV